MESLTQNKFNINEYAEHWVI